VGNSFTFNATDLSDYELVVTSSRPNVLGQIVPFIQLKDRGYGSGIKREPRPISIDIDVKGTSRADLDSNLDNIKRIITTEIDQQLIFDILLGRYFMARLTDFDGQYKAATLYSGSIDFICVDPLGYSITQTESNHPLTGSDPKTVTETVTGTGMVNPVYTLTAGANLGAITVKLENVTTDEELQWTGSLGDGHYLTIDVPNWIVKLNGSASMSGISGQFPRLQPGANSIKVTAMAVTGVMGIIYKNNYL